MTMSGNRDDQSSDRSISSSDGDYANPWRWSTLHDNDDAMTTRFETHLRLMRTAVLLPSETNDNSVTTMWTIAAAVSIIYAIFAAVVLASIVQNRKIRRDPFHLYLIYLMFPDVLYITFFAGLSIWQSHMGTLFQPTNPDLTTLAGILCHAHSFVLVFTLIANSYLNALIAREVYDLLAKSHIRQRYFAPSRRTVTQNAVVVYTAALILAALSIADLPGLPLRTEAIEGLFCAPVGYDTPSTYFWWFVFLPLLNGIPSVYIIGCMYQVWKHQMLPPPGRRRTVAVYFFRIALVLFVAYLPSMIALHIIGDVGPWWTLATALFSCAYVPVTAAASLWKEDIWVSFLNFVCCRKADNTSSATTTPTGDKSGVSLNRRHLDVSGSSQWFWRSASDGFGGSSSRQLPSGGGSPAASQRRQRRRRSGEATTYISGLPSSAIFTDSTEQSESKNYNGPQPQQQQQQVTTTKQKLKPWNGSTAASPPPPPLPDDDDDDAYPMGGDKAEHKQQQTMLESHDCHDQLVARYY
jgi:hypothetical protein